MHLSGAGAVAASTIMHGVFLDDAGSGRADHWRDRRWAKKRAGAGLISPRPVAWWRTDAVRLLALARKRWKAAVRTCCAIFLEVRGLGILNIRAIFGETAVLRKVL